MERLLEVLRLGFLLAIVVTDMLTRVTGCFNRHQDIALCMRRNNISIPIFRGPSGFDFGWGSLDETEEMCRTRGHILTLTCMKALVNERCRGSHENTLKRLLLDAVFDVSPYKRAANYLCHKENMRIFKENRECLKQQERQAERCAKQKAEAMENAMKDLRKNTDNNDLANAVEYKNFVYKIIHGHQCSGQRGSMKCIYYHINSICSRQIVLLLMNYYKELLPENCPPTVDLEDMLRVDSYETRNDQARPRSNISRHYEVRSNPRISAGYLRPSLTVILTSALIWTVGVIP